MCEQTYEILNWDDTKWNDSLVTVRCITFKQEKFIAQTIESIVAQQTTFKYQVIIHDDASPDGNPEIIRRYAEKYPDKIVAVLNHVNQYSNPNGSIWNTIRPYMRGKYVAFIEGDDYWTDPLKLQKQIEYMEAHPECTMCYGKAIVYNQKMDRVLAYTVGREVSGFKELLVKNVVPTLTAILRDEIMEEYTFWNREWRDKHKKWYMGDRAMWLYASLKGKVHFFDEVFSCYRQLEESESHSTTIEKVLRFEESSYDMTLFFIEHFCPDDEELKQKMAYLHVKNDIMSYISCSHFFRARREIRHSILSEKDKKKYKKVNNLRLIYHLASYILPQKLINKLAIKFHPNYKAL